jgi:tryptophan synthase alpha chain
MGLTEIQKVFVCCKAENRPALMPYWPLGYPDADTSLKVIESIVRAGADMLEIGVPFSDPLADGPIIQHASQVALEHGITVQRCIDLAGAVRQRGITIPLLAMGYLNPLLAYGPRRYVEAWRQAGADGFIIPDLPPEESAELAALCAENQMALVSFTAPTSTEKRIELAAAHASGFIYVVAVTGVTGARDQLAGGLREYVERVRAKSMDKPIVVGFGISKPEHVREVGQYANGVIVASALIRAAGDRPDPARAAYEFVRYLKS